MAAEQPAVTASVPNPARITLALDVRGLHGPGVDLACGVEEPDVDRWEDPADPLLPTPEQVELLAALVGYPVAFFYDHTPIPGGRMFICDRTRRKHGLTVIEADGTVSLEPPPLRRRTTPEDAMARKPAHPRTPRRGPQPTRVKRHPFVADPDVPADADGGRYCARCGCRGEPGDTHHLADGEPERPPVAGDVSALERRRYGETGDDT
jgi:hypothetical protein